MRKPTTDEWETYHFVECAGRDHQPDFDQPRQLCEPPIRAVACACGRITWTPTETKEDA